MHSYKASHYCYRLAFEALEHGEGSADNQISRLSALKLIYWLNRTLSKHWLHSHRKYEDDSHNLAKKVYS